MSDSSIIIRGAREHNLQNINLELPRNQLICMTGVSGSGKSSLAFDTLYAEGQRRYVESLSSFARQFLGQMPKPDVDTISGLAPSISIQQKTSSRNPRSTVGTITEIYDYLRVLFARVGQGYCEQCGDPITAQSLDKIVDAISKQKGLNRFLVLAPVVQQQKGEYRDLFEDLLKRGYLRARVDGKIVQLDEDLNLDRQMRHTIEVVVDRLVKEKTSRQRLSEAVESAIKLSDGTLLVVNVPGKEDTSSTIKEKIYSSRYVCARCNLAYEPPSPQLFSFNSPLGMCLECNGLGMRHEFLIKDLIPNEKLSIKKGAILLLGKWRSNGRWKRHIYEGAARAIEQQLNLSTDSLLTTPWKDLSEKAKKLYLFGLGDLNVTFSWRHSGGTWKHGGKWIGYIPELLESYRTARNPMRRRQLEKYMEFIVCSDCQGARLNRQAQHVRITSNSKLFKKRIKNSNHKNRYDLSCSLPVVCRMTIQEAAEYFDSLELDQTSQLIAEEALKEIRGRLGFLLRCGLDYLTLDRTAPTLSGGESQRIRLAGQIGCGLVGVVYILDEPSIGLHPRDNSMLLDSLRDLRDQGNTVIVVEHDEETMRAADHIVDFGPGPGVRGGEVVVEGNLNDVKQNRLSLTGQYLSGKMSIPLPDQRRPLAKKKLTVKGARHNNLKNIDVSFPLGQFICVTGVSGSGKSSLVNDILWQVLNRDVNQGKGKPGKHTRINGLKQLDKAIDINQSPIGRTPRSNPATYVKLFDPIRQLFAQLPESRVRGYQPGRFSFNVSGGRCEACEGYGMNKLEMDFLADVWVTCPVCKGNRFNHETLEVKYKGKSIAEVLQMDIQEAITHFENIPKILKLLQTLHDVGLDYLKLGQPSPTLSGGEAQRIKLARELGKRSTGNTIYLLDEPTTGLHFADINMLLEVLHGFVEAGNTVLVIEHNLDVIKTADWVIDLGPEGGAGGGGIIAQGPPEEIAACKNSYTGMALTEVLRGRVKGKKTKQPIAKRRTVESNKSVSARWQINTGSTYVANNEITVRGAAQHNLRQVDVAIPREKMSVFCGPSGSGKSSLAMDTLYAEGQRRYVESLSSYARQFLGQMPKPKVEHIHGLSPAIAIEQKNSGTTPRSTVGTVTEIYDYLRILFTRLGSSYCPKCDIPVQTQTTDDVIEQIIGLPAKTKCLLLAPLEVAVGQSYEKTWERIQLDGFQRVRIDGEVHRINEVPKIDRRRKHQLEVVVDRLTIDRKKRSRIADSIETALSLGQGTIRVATVEKEVPETEWLVVTYSLHFVCSDCGRSFEELTPHNFSFNSPLGWCDACEGLGIEQGTNLSLLIADRMRTLNDEAVAAWPSVKSNQLFAKMLASMAEAEQIPLDVPYAQLEPAQQRKILQGTPEKWYWLELRKGLSFQFQYKGVYPAIEEASRVSYKYRQQLGEMIGEVPCSVCQGSRLRDDAAARRFQGKRLQQICDLPLTEALKFLKSIKLNASDKRVAGELLIEATSRLSFLVDVGLTYLTLSRSLPTLSGGESQRIRLAGQIGRALTGVLYVLDEPTIGLHPRDNEKLLSALHRLRKLGNTLLLVEHDRDVIAASDQLYDFGPGAGQFGGEIIAQGSPKQLQRRKRSLTGEYLASKKEIPIPENRRMPSIDEKNGRQLSISQSLTPPGGGWIKLSGARKHNLRNVTLQIPLGTFTCITGVSGSGKSSLIEETLAPAVSKYFSKSPKKRTKRNRLTSADETKQYTIFDELTGLENINKVIIVDQKPLGNTPASNPATYTGLFEHIRNLFSRLPEAKVRGYRPGRFSFNRSGGRCDDCEGNGQKKIEMHFLPDVWVQCETCRGQRYNQETLTVKFQGHSIADVLEMSIDDALKLFRNIPKIRRFLATLSAIGLGYLTLGQSAPTLSGGEAQRVKLAAELARPSTGKTLYLLDEPTTGLHFDDINKLLKVLNSLVEQGNTVVVIEHNLDVIKTADWVVDIGPEAGLQGGNIIAAGTPEDLVEYAKHYQLLQTSRQRKKQHLLPSHTGRMLIHTLEHGTRQQRDLFDISSVAQKQRGDLELNQVGKNAKMPWQLDGRAWHTLHRLSRNGKQCQWEGKALAYVVDLIEEDGRFAVTKWNDRATVEITGLQQKGNWFFHALSGDEWLLSLTFRVKKNTFQREALKTALNLKPIDELDELPIYGRRERVKVKNLKGPFQQITIQIHWLRELETDAFHQFLNVAMDSFQQQIQKSSLNPNDLTPWKVLKQKWHLSRKGFHSNKRVLWSAETLSALFQLLENIFPAAEFDYTNKVIVNVKPGKSAKPNLQVHTKRREAISLLIFVEPGKFALGQLTNLGIDRSISQHRDGRDCITIQFDGISQVRKKNLRQFLQGIWD